MSMEKVLFVLLSEALITGHLADCQAWRLSTNMTFVMLSVK